MPPGDEDGFRVWAFHIFYRRTYRGEVDLLLRFVKALLASARPIRNPELLAAWQNSYAESPHADVETISAAGG